MHDCCTLHELAEVLRYSSAGTANGLSYLKIQSNIADIDTIASDPVGVCFCKEGQPDCSYKLPSIQVTKGETFSLQVVAVDQVNHTLDAKTIASTDGYLGEGQQFHAACKSCTKLQFNLYSFRSSEIVRLYPIGSCSDSEVSQATVVIKFTPCVCPTGFERAQPIDDSRCECTCNLNLLPHIN